MSYSAVIVCFFSTHAVTFNWEVELLEETFQGEHWELCGSPTPADSTTV